tara:strand:- start:1319 stop:1615 length:297 start_codon:yes stop_codon:yes gene_type:complete
VNDHLSTGECPWVFSQHGVTNSVKLGDVDGLTDFAIPFGCPHDTVVTQPVREATQARPNVNAKITKVGEPEAFDTLTVPKNGYVDNLVKAMRDTKTLF